MQPIQRALAYSTEPSRLRRFQFLPMVAAMLAFSYSVDPVAGASGGKGEWRKHQIYTGASALTAVGGDFTGDGLPDVITNSDGRTRLLVAPEWKEIPLGPEEERNFIHSEVLDVDGDGDLDWVGARYKPGLITWLEQPDNPGTDAWKERLVDDQVDGIHGLLTGDVDRDGRLDLLATSAQPMGPFPDSLVWYRVPENPKQADSWHRFVFANRDAPGLSHYLGFGDVNGDGRPDIASAAKGGPSDTTGLGNWFAWWEAPKDPEAAWKRHRLGGVEPGATNIHPADVNGDGRVDFVASRGHANGVIWFEAPHWKVHDIHPEIREPHALTVADLDQDGDMDAATCAFGSKMAAWYENDGAGRFRIHVLDRDQESYDIRAVDLDGDGDLDLLVAGRLSHNVVWYENPLR